MQINGSIQIATFVTSVAPTFFGCIALLDLFLLLGFTVTLLALLKCARYFAPAGATTGFALWIPTSL